jgi:hypothetical protein
MTVWLDEAALPHGFGGPDDLEEFMSRPSRALLADLAAIDGDIMVLGVGGKIGPTRRCLMRRSVLRRVRCSSI